MGHCVFITWGCALESHNAFRLVPCSIHNLILPMICMLEKNQQVESRLCRFCHVVRKFLTQGSYLI